MNQSELKKYQGYCNALARHYCNRFHGAFDFEDLQSVAYEGLCLALTKLDEKQSFQRYIWLTIKGTLQKYIRDSFTPQVYTTAIDNDGEETDILDTLPSESDFAEESANRHLLENIKRQIERMPKKQRRYGLLMLAGYCQTEAARELNVSKEAVGQTHKIVVGKLRKRGLA